nr:hypothetical protein [Tanacetum cinerariifolium]
MDDPNITIEEYIRLEEEKARKRRKVTDTSSLVNHDAYLASSSAPQITYTQMDQQSSAYSPPEAG